MEAIGAAASLVTVIALARKAAVVCLEYAVDVKNAPESIMLLAQELKALEFIGERLEKIQNNKQIENGFQDAFLVERLSSTGLLDTYKKQLDKLTKKTVGNHPMPKGLVQRLAFPIREKRIAETLKTIHTVRDILMTASCLDDSQYIRSTHTQVNRMVEVFGRSTNRMLMDNELHEPNLNSLTLGYTAHTQSRQFTQSSPAPRDRRQAWGPGVDSCITILKPEITILESFIGAFHIERCTYTLAERRTTRRSEAEERSGIKVKFTPSTRFIRTLIRFYVEWKLSRDRWLLPHFDLRFDPVLPDDHGIFQASRNGNIKMLERFISGDKTLPLCVNSDGWSSLHFAAASGHTTACKLLMSNGPANTQYGIREINPLHVAAHFGHVETFQALVVAGWDPEDWHENGQNAIFDVLSHRNIAGSTTCASLVKWLLHGQDMFPIDTRSRDSNGRGIAHYLLFLDGSEGGITNSIEAFQNPFLLKLIRGFAHLDDLDEFGKTLLHYACEQQNYELVQMLVMAGCDINVIDTKGRCLLDYAILSGENQLERVRLLLDLGADAVSVLTPYELCSPFEVAASWGPPEIMQLLYHAAGRDKKRLHTQEAFQRAVHHHRYDVVRFLIDAAKEYLDIDLGMSCAQSLDMIEILVSAGGSVNGSRRLDENVPICRAAHYRDPALVQKLIQLGADVNKPEEGLTALYYAAQGGREEVVDMLLKAGADVLQAKSKGALPAVQAKKHGYHNLALKLESMAGVVERSNSTEQTNGVLNSNMAEENGHVRYKLMGAIENEDLSVFQELLEKIDDVNYRCDMPHIPTTPLSFAISWKRWDMARILICAGAEMNVFPAEDQHQQRKRPFHDAVASGNCEMVKFMLNHGARVDLRDCEGETPLIRSLSPYWWKKPTDNSRRFSNASIVRLLVDAGSDVNAVSFEGRTPLGLAAAGDIESVSILIAAGASINTMSVKHPSVFSLRGTRSHTPIGWAALDRHEDIVELLLKAGADWRGLKKDPALWYTHRFLMRSWFPEGSEDLGQAHERNNPSDDLSIKFDELLSISNKTKTATQGLPVSTDSTSTTQPVQARDGQRTHSPESVLAILRARLPEAAKTFFLGLMLTLPTLAVLSLRLLHRTLTEVRATPENARIYYILLGLLLSACLQRLF